MSYLIWLGIVLVVSIAVVAGAYVLVSHRSPKGGYKDQTPHDLYALTSGAMALLVAFTFGVAFGNFTDMRTQLRTEEAAVLSMYRYAALLPEPVGQTLRNDSLCYAQLVIKDEWPTMEAGEVPLFNSTTTLVEDIQQTLIKNNDAESALSKSPYLSTWIAANTQRADARLIRISSATNGTIPITMWILLIIGAILSIAALFIYADRDKPKWGHVLVVVGPVFIAVSALMVIYLLSRPFLPVPGALTSEGFQKELAVMQHEAVLQSENPTPACPGDTATQKAFGN